MTYAKDVCHGEQREAIAPERNRSDIVLVRLPRPCLMRNMLARTDDLRKFYTRYERCCENERPSELALFCEAYNNVVLQAAVTQLR